MSTVEDPKFCFESLKGDDKWHVDLEGTDGAGAKLTLVKFVLGNTLIGHIWEFFFSAAEIQKCIEKSTNQMKNAFVIWLLGRARSFCFRLLAYACITAQNGSNHAPKDCWFRDKALETHVLSGWLLFYCAVLSTSSGFVVCGLLQHWQTSMGIS